MLVGPEVGSYLWRSLLKRGVTPCGLGARDTLRLEAEWPSMGKTLMRQQRPGSRSRLGSSLGQGQFYRSFSFLEQQQLG